MMVMLLIMLISGDDDRVMISVHLNNANVLLVPPYKAALMKT